MFLVKGVKLVNETKKKEGATSFFKKIPFIIMSLLNFLYMYIYKIFVETKTLARGEMGGRGKDGCVGITCYKNCTRVTACDTHTDCATQSGAGCVRVIQVAKPVTRVPTLPTSPHPPPCPLPKSWPPWNIRIHTIVCWLPSRQHIKRFERHIYPAKKLFILRLYQASRKSTCQRLKSFTWISVIPWYVCSLILQG